MLRVWYLVLVVAALLIAAGQGDRGHQPQLVCVDVRDVGLEGAEPFWGAAVWDNGRLRPVQLYVVGERIQAIGIWEVNSTAQPRDLLVVPPRLRGEICFEPGPPVYSQHAPRGRAKYVEVDTPRGRVAVYLVRIDENPYAIPPIPVETPLAERKPAARVVDIQPPRKPEITPMQIASPAYMFRDFSGTIVAVFTLRETDNQPLGGYKRCAEGRFNAPNGTLAAYLVFSPSTRREDNYGYLGLRVTVTDKNGKLIHDEYVQVPTSPKPWYIVPLYNIYVPSGGVNMTYRVQICKDWYGWVDLVNYYIDAYVVLHVAARSYAVPFRLASPAQGAWVGVVKTQVDKNGTHLIIPGFNPPPGYVVNSGALYLSIRTCSPNPPPYLNIYWGLVYVTTVYGYRDDSGCTSYVAYLPPGNANIDIATRTSLWLGGNLHTIVIGPINRETFLSGITISDLRVEGYYRPDMNARRSIAFKEYALPWARYGIFAFQVLSGYDLYPGQGYYYIYGDKVDIVLYRHGTEKTTYATIYIGKIDSPFTYHCGRVSIWFSAYDSNWQRRIVSSNLANVYAESWWSGMRIEILQLIGEFVVNIMDELKTISNTVLKSISWALFATSLLGLAADASISIANDGGMLRVDISPGFATNALVARVALRPSVIEGRYYLSVERVEVSCGGSIQRFTSPYRAYFDIDFVSAMSNLPIHQFRTLTCGKPELSLTYLALCNVDSYG